MEWALRISAWTAVEFGRNIRPSDTAMSDPARVSINKIQPPMTPPANPEPDTGSLPSAAPAPTRRPGPEAIREQLAKLLASPRFASSQRCQLLLTYVVEETLGGNADSLKERNIGIAVFKRDPAYDTNADPTVRVAVSEIRKKLAQYYYEPGNQDQVRIEMPMGTYAPTFSLPESPTANGPVFSLTETEQSALAISRLEHSAARTLPNGISRRRLGTMIASAVCFLLLVTAVVAWKSLAERGPLEVFWAPFLKSPNPALICTGQLGNVNGATSDNKSGTSVGSIMVMGPNGFYSKEITTIELHDAITLANVAGVLRSKNKPYNVRNASETKYEDLQQGPLVLIGSFNNQWVLHFTQAMRYRFGNDSANFQWIADQTRPETMLGKQRVDQEVFGSEEYALVARVFQPEIKEPTIILAGVTAPGTLAAGQFATSPQQLGDFLKTAPAGWQSKNLEIILSVNVVDNQPSPPRVVASVVW